MKKQSAMTPPQYKGRSLLKGIGIIIIRMVGASLGLAFSFWLLLASNMGRLFASYHGWRIGFLDSHDFARGGIGYLDKYCRMVNMAHTVLFL